MRTRLVGLVALSVLASTSALRAAMLDLSTLGASGTINGAVFAQGNSHVTGTGNIDSFVRIQANDTEQGYNTSGSPVPFDDKASYVRDVRLGTMGILPDGAGYVLKLYLDLNQSGDTLISLDKFQIYLTTTPAQTTTAFLANGDLALANALKVYDMDAGADNFVKLDGALHQGSGLHDMSVDIPVTPEMLAFDPARTYFVLFARFGDNFASNDGFEEFWFDKGSTYNFDNPPPIPEPGTMGLAALGAGMLMRRRRA